MNTVIFIVIVGAGSLLAVLLRRASARAEYEEAITARLARYCGRRIE